MKKNRRWLVAIVVSLVMILSMLTPTIAGGHEGYENGVYKTPLLAGQDMEVGEVIVWNDGENLYVKYELNEGAIEEEWGITETHLHIANGLEDFPYAGRTKNPVPGRFDYKRSYDPPVTEDTYIIPLGDLEPGDEIFIGAHAVVEKVDLEVIMEAPYGGSGIVEYVQGLRYNYTPVRAQRSNAETVLTFETGQNEANFFSLGFQEDREEYPDVDNAWIIIEFDTPILNGPGDDLRVIEDTWGLPYPDETAAVWVSQDGMDWKYLGEADNQTPFMNYHTITDFDLETVGLDYARYVKVQDTSKRADFAHLSPGQDATLDGFDLNAVVALQDHVIIEEYDETAWGFGPRFTPRGNWATYFKYTIQETTEIVKFPEAGNAYIGFEDRLTGSDFDYNDFGMNMELEETYENGVLKSIEMEFTAVVNDAGDVHDIHIARALLGDYSYTVERSRGATVREQAAGMDILGSGEFDIVLFDTANFPGIVGQTLNDWVKITITMAEGNDQNLLEDYEPADRFDLSEVFSLYEPYMFNRNTGNDIRLGSFDMFKDVQVPLILIVPFNDWEAPAEGQPIDQKYPGFLNYYDTEGAEDADWFELE